jgi:hypothetical protein
MNAGSRKKGVGGKRPRARSVNPDSRDHERLPAPRGQALVEPVGAEAKSAEALGKVRAEAMGGLTDLVGLAIGTLRDCLVNGPQRAQGSRSSDARYVLDVVLDRIAQPAEVGDDVEIDKGGKPTQTPVDELAKRRAELVKLVRAQRKDSSR